MLMWPADLSIKATIDPSFRQTRCERASRCRCRGHTGVQAGGCPCWCSHAATRAPRSIRTPLSLVCWRRWPRRAVLNRHHARTSPALLARPLTGELVPRRLLVPTPALPDSAASCTAPSPATPVLLCWLLRPALLSWCAWSLTQPLSGADEQPAASAVQACRTRASLKGSCR